MRLNFTYTKYRNSKIATAINWLGGLLFSLGIYGGLLMAAFGVITCFTESFSAGLEYVFCGVIFGVIAFVIRIASSFLSSFVASLGRRNR